METEQKVAAPAVARAARILDLLAHSSCAVSLAALARELQLPKSSLHGLCSTLAELRLVTRLENGDMTLGPHVMSWANAFLANSDDIVQAFYNTLQDAPTFSEETITLSVQDGDNVIYVTSRKGTRPLGVTFQVGMRLPAPFTATGKAMLSTHSNDHVCSMFGNAWPKPLTSGSVQNLQSLLEQIEQIRSHGYSVDDGEICEGLYCIGAPVFGAGSKHAIAGVAISFLSHEMNDAKRDAAGQAMRLLADRLSERLGALPRLRAAR